MGEVYKMTIAGCDRELPICPISDKLDIAGFVMFGDVEITEKVAQALMEKCPEHDIIITAESKGLQLSHVIARELGQRYYAVCRKSKKLYMQDGIQTSVKSITTGNEQTLYLSKHDADLIKGKKVAIVDDVVSTGGSLRGLEQIVNLAGGIIYKKAFVLAEGDAAERDDIVYLAKIPIITD